MVNGTTGPGKAGGVLETWIHKKREWVRDACFTLLLLQVVFVSGIPTGLTDVTPKEFLKSFRSSAMCRKILICQVSTLPMVIFPQNHKGGEMLITSKQPTITCNKEEVDTLAENVQGICSCITDIDDYVQKVFSREEVLVTPFNDEYGFKVIIDQYNGHIKTTKDHCNHWRNGDSIFGSLKEVVVVAQGFGPKVTSDFEKTLELVKHIVQHHENINEVEAKLAKLEHQTKKANEMVQLTNDSVVISYLDTIIKLNEEDIKTITTENNVTKARQELEALTDYLEGVRLHAAQIEKKAENVRNKISDFKETTLQDATELKRHRTNAQEGMQRISQEKVNHHQELVNLQIYRDNLQTKIAQERAQITQLNAQIHTAQNELRELEHSINRSDKKAKRKKKFGKIFRVAVPVVGWIAGSQMEKNAKRRERELAEIKRSYITLHTQVVQNLHTQIKNGNQDIALYQSSISTHIVKSGQLEEELNNFSKLDIHLQGIEHEADSVLPFMAKALISMIQMKDTYDSVKQDLQNVIEKAKEAKGEAEIKNIIYFIYNEIETMKCKWEHANEKLVLVEQCN